MKQVCQFCGEYWMTFGKQYSRHAGDSLASVAYRERGPPRELLGQPNLCSLFTCQFPSDRAAPGKEP